MTVYIDQLKQYDGKRKHYAHLMADSTEELHKFAAMIDVKRCWFHKDHYDLSQDKFDDAVLSGAIVVTSRELVQLRKDRRAKI